MTLYQIIVSRLLAGSAVRTRDRIARPRRLAASTEFCVCMCHTRVRISCVTITHLVKLESRFRGHNRSTYTCRRIIIGPMGLCNYRASPDKLQAHVASNPIRKWPDISLLCLTRLGPFWACALSFRILLPCGLT